VTIVRDKPFAIWVLLTVIAVMTLILGLVIDFKVKEWDRIGDLLYVGGSALFGVGVGGLIGAWTGKDFLENTKQILRDSLRPQVLSEDHSVAPFRSKMHHYHVTRSEKKDWSWRYSLLDFGTQMTVNQLIGSIEFPENNRTKHIYKVIAGIKGSRMVLWGERQTGEETSFVEIYPFMGNLHLGEYHCGMLIGKNWSNEDMVSAVILSFEPLHRNKLLESNYLDQQDGKKLEKTWQKRFFKKNIILPTLVDASAFNIEPSRLSKIHHTDSSEVVKETEIVHITIEERE
jgi:hypothetical protein